MKFTFDAVYVANNTHKHTQCKDKFRCQEPERRFNAAFYVLRIAAINSHLVSDLMSTKRLSVDSRNLYGICSVRNRRYACMLKLNDRTKHRCIDDACGTYRRQRWNCNSNTVYLQFIVHSHCSRIHWKHPHNSARKTRLNRIPFIHKLMLEIACDAAVDKRLIFANTMEEIRYSTRRTGSVPLRSYVLGACVWVSGRRSISIHAFCVIESRSLLSLTIQWIRRCDAFIAINDDIHEIIDRVRREVVVA